jgi:DNA adenine methylase
MRYQGGKTMVGRHIARIIQRTLDKYPDRTYFEPFVGAGGVLRHIKAKKVRICDGLADTTRFWNALLHNDWLPPKRQVTESEFLRQKKQKPSAMRFYVGHQFSFGGQFFHGFIKNSGKTPWLGIKLLRDKVQANTGRVSVCTNRDYQRHSPRNMIIYCDPPYRGTTGYTGRGDFDHTKFWALMEEWSKHNIVFVSETKAPRGWSTVWSRAIKVVGGNFQNGRMIDNTLERRERLFVHKSNVNKL